MRHRSEAALASALLLSAFGCASTRTAERAPLGPAPGVEPAPKVQAQPAATVAPAVQPAREVPQAPPKMSALRVNVVPANAMLSINGQAQGAVDALGTPPVLPLEPGLYRIVLSSPGYQTWRGEVAVGETQQSIQVKLVKAIKRR